MGFFIKLKKETFYFSHDYTAKSDEKIKNLIYEFGYEGYGIYWSLIEELYQNANALQTNYKRIAFDMRIDENKVKSIIENFDLFIVENGFFGSLSVQRRLDMRNEKSNKARESAQKRWTKDANALPMQSDSNAIKESKVKENKLKEVIDIDFFNEVWELYNKKLNKEESFKAFKKIKSNEYELIKNHIPNFVKQFKDKQFQPYFSTYLNKKRWQDEVETKQPVQPRLERRATLND
jgi:hypothetical protein